MFGVGSCTVAVNELVALCVANPLRCCMRPSRHATLCGKRFALIGVIGFSNGHYMALSHRLLVCSQQQVTWTHHQQSTQRQLFPQGWKLFDDMRQEYNTLEAFLHNTAPTTFIYQQECKQKNNTRLDTEGSSNGKTTCMMSYRPARV